MVGTGSQISHYRIVSELGRGGMGVVYLAEDTVLNRKVALKFLKPDAIKTPEAEARLVLEARVASALDHPSIATIHEIGEWEGQRFIVMAYYDGHTLDAHITRGNLPIDQAVTLLVQIADAIGLAHQAGIVHRDLKPGNIILTPEGVPKVLDFGLAIRESVDAVTAMRLTTAGSTVGTVAYMSPEQAMGRSVDHRTDLWALGVVAFELLTGRAPFAGGNVPALLHAITYEPAPDVSALRPDVPRQLSAAVARALSKDVETRYQSASAFAADLRAWQAEVLAGRTQQRVWSSLRNPAVAVPLVVVLGALILFSVREIRRASAEQWVREEALPAIAQLVDAERFAEAFSLATRVQAVVPADPTLERLRPLLQRTPAIRSTPEGVSVAYRPYNAPESEAWTTLGVTPLTGAAVPTGFHRWRFTKDGFDPVEFARGAGAPAPAPPAEIVAELRPAAPETAGMVAVPGAPEPFSVFLPGFETLTPVRMPETYWVDRFEVTNQQFKAFVDAGGYQKREHWQEPFVEGGRVVAWEDAMARFRDATARPGPATWAEGEFPAGQGSYPVGGVSWYEAAAYAHFVGKRLPTLYHWTKAADPRTAVWVVPFSNMAGTGPVPAGSRRALHVWGTEDMAGNVKEWVQNDAGDGRRYILGGGWDEPTYVFNEPDAQSPFDRKPTFGFRCVRLSGEPTGALTASVRWPTRDYSKEKPAPDNVFEIYRRLYAYDRSPISTQAPVVNDQDENWRRELVSIPTGYGEQMKLFLYLPKQQKPPYQAVIYFPGANYLRTRSFDQIPVADFNYIVKSGRAVALPVFKGTFDRQTALDDSTANTTILYRDHVIAWVKETRRSIDYLETRTDLSLDRLALVGRSWGGRMGSIIPAIEPRVKVEVLVIGGFSMQQAPPEVDQINFASRVTIPVLMLNGRYDFFFPTDTSQKPMFNALGTPPDHKRHVLFDGGHNVPRLEMIKETLNWLDRYQAVPGRESIAAPRP